MLKISLKLVIVVMIYERLKVMQIIFFRDFEYVTVIPFFTYHCLSFVPASTDFNEVSSMYIIDTNLQNLLFKFSLQIKI